MPRLNSRTFAFGAAASVCLAITAAQGQPLGADAYGEHIGQVQQPIINGDPVPAQVQRDLGLITVGGRCSGTLLNRFWVLTADHCVTTNGTAGGPSETLTNLPITAEWSDRTVLPTRLVRNWGPSSGLDIALVFLGAGDFGNANVQLLFVDDVDTSVTLTKFGRGIVTYADPGTPPVPAQGGQYRSAVFKPSAVSATSYTLPVNHQSQVGAGGDSGGPDRVTTPDGVILGIAGVQSRCSLTSVVPGKPSTWAWATEIRSCTSAAISTVRSDIVQIIQEGRIPCPDSSAACAIAETTSLTLMLH